MISGTNTTYEAMTLCQLASRYGVNVRTVRKWLGHFAEDIRPLPGSYVFTPAQVKQIVEACGEFPG